MEKDKMPLAQVDFSEFAPPTYEEWKAEAIASLKGAPFDKKLLTDTYEGITLEPLYTPEHAADFAQKSSFPGADHFLRGSKATGYTRNPWLAVQKITAHNLEEANQQLKDDLAKGGQAISFCSHDIKLDTLADINKLLADIDITKAAFNIVPGANAMPLVALLKAYCQQNAIDSQKLFGVIGADPLFSLAIEGELEASIDCYYQQMADLIKFTAEHMPQLETIYVQGSVYHNGGADAATELAAVMATAISYIDALIEKGLDIDTIAGQIRFQLPIGANFFMEIAKIRAARMIWAQIIKAYGGNEKSAAFHVCATTSSFTMTAYDPYVNVLRSTTQAFAGVVAGANCLSVKPFNAVNGNPDQQSRRIARNIQNMLKSEFNLLSPIDPAGGSWYLETLTGQLAEKAWQKIQDIEAKGGMLAVLTEGSLQADIEAVWQKRQKKLATRADKVVGINMYANNLEKLDLACTCGCNCACNQEEAAAIEINLDGTMADLVAAIAKGMPLSQASIALAKGNSPKVNPITKHRLTEQFESMRLKTEAAEQDITIFLANMGPVSQHKARADFSAGFMEVGGFKVIGNDGFATVDEAAQAAIAAKPTAVVICSTDDTYPEIVPALTKAIKAANSKTGVILAGMPAAEYKDSYLAAGLDDCIHVKADCLAVLTKIQNMGGIE